MKRRSEEDINMKAECQNTFMIRTPNLPIKYLEEYKKQEKDIYEFIKQDKDLERFFQKALLISSPDIYRSYLNKPKVQFTRDYTG